jgi:hypothetical protein
MMTIAMRRTGIDDDATGASWRYAFGAASRSGRRAVRHGGPFRFVAMRVPHNSVPAIFAVPPVFESGQLLPRGADWPSS